ANGSGDLTWRELLHTGNSDKFNSSGDYTNLRARATTKGDVGLSNVRNVASYSQTEADSRFLNEDNNLSDLDNTTTAQTNLKLKDGTADLDFHSLAISSNEEGLLVGQNVPVRIATARDASRGSVTVQPTATAPGSVELFPGGTSERSHFLATNATDEDNFGFVELEVNKKDSWIAPGVKGAGDIPVNFRVWGFQKGISLQDNVSIGVNIDSPDPLTVQGGFPQVRLVRDANTDQGLTLQGGAGNAIYDSYNVGGNTFPQHTFRTTNDTTSEDILNLDYSNGSTFYTGLTVGGITTFKDDIETDHFSDWFSANPTGFQVSYDGTGDFRTVLTDELNAKAFTADVAQALAGSDFLTKSVAKLASDFVVPAVGSTVTIKVEDLEGLTNLQTFEASDWVRFRVFDRSGGGLRILDVYG